MDMRASLIRLPEVVGDAQVSVGETRTSPGEADGDTLLGSYGGL